jgi:hypothetical protein
MFTEKEIKIEKHSSSGSSSDSKETTAGAGRRPTQSLILVILTNLQPMRKTTETT